MAISIEFIKYFFIYIYFALPLLMAFIIMITLLGGVVGRIEGWKKFDTLYWTFITALTIGYGDIKPTQRHSRIISIFIGLLGIMFTGLIVAITIAVATKVFGVE